jgi:hypothetical protein
MVTGNAVHAPIASLTISAVHRLGTAKPVTILRRATVGWMRAGFRIVRQSKYIVMSNGARILTIPRNDPVNACTVAGIVRDAGLTLEEFRKLL